MWRVCICGDENMGISPKDVDERRSKEVESGVG